MIQSAFEKNAVSCGFPIAYSAHCVYNERKLEKEGERKRMAAEKSMVEWLISAVGARSPRTNQDLAKHFFVHDPEGVFSNAYEARNSSKVLFTKKKTNASGWKKATLPSALAIEGDPAPVAAALTASYGGSDLFEKLRLELRRDFYEKRPESAEPAFAESRLRVWLDLLSMPGREAQESAEALAMLFAEVVLSMEEGMLRPGGDALLAGILQKGRGGEHGAPVPAEAHPRNIRMLGRRVLEKEKENLIADRLRGAVKVQMLNITAIGLIDGHEDITKVDYKRNIFETCLESGTKFEVVLPRAGSVGETDAGTFKLRQGYKADEHGNMKDGMTMIARTRKKLIEDLRVMKKRQAADDPVPPISLYFTDCAIPYALMIVTFGADEYEVHPLDHVKVDLLSPYLSDDLTRRSFFVSRTEDPDNYNFFVDNFRAILQNSMPYVDREE